VPHHANVSRKIITQQFTAFLRSDSKTPISPSPDPINGIFLVFGDKKLKGLGANPDSPQAFHDTP
jgi:hypothetical protein